MNLFLKWVSFNSRKYSTFHFNLKFQVCFSVGLCSISASPSLSGILCSAHLLPRYRFQELKVIGSGSRTEQRPPENNDLIQCSRYNMITSIQAMAFKWLVRLWTWIEMGKLDGTQPDDEMHAILGGPINEEE
ncbi:hypothetical protein FEM48_Zijuj08G0049400 [Ziziphus jujuba var. spinosa]|uniref:Uncharacterized protein n=1 Tax=Ziziphus jujuba var. spinosa TaxID=714518 RepID=A0A978UX39_ZIZJJ|nr:hypothetical protein FEM48_Zijuj08G0049400 [Ziziphus jujuba var. spinosa]